MTEGHVEGVVAEYIPLPTMAPTLAKSDQGMSMSSGASVSVLRVRDLWTVVY